MRERERTEGGRGERKGEGRGERCSESLGVAGNAVMGGCEGRV